MGGVLLEDIGLPIGRHPVTGHLGHALAVDLRGQRRRVVRVHQAARHFHEVRIAQPIRAVGKRQLHRLRHHVQALGFAQGLQVESPPAC